MFVEAVRRVRILENCNLCCKNERLLVDAFRDTPYVVHTVVSLWLFSNIAERA